MSRPNHMEHIILHAESLYRQHKVLANILGAVSLERYEAEANERKSRRSFDNEYRGFERRNARSRWELARVKTEQAQHDEQRTETTYNQNITDSAEHYAAHAEAYHQQAIQDAGDAGVKIEFDAGAITGVPTVK